MKQQLQMEIDEVRGMKSTFKEVNERLLVVEKKFDGYDAVLKGNVYLCFFK